MSDMHLNRFYLKDLASISLSGVDKKISPSEEIVRLCNYVDVYKNYAVTSLDYDHFMVASASQREIDGFSLKKGDIAITKDSETRDDIGMPCYIADDFNHKVLLGYHCALIRANSDLIDSKYLTAYLNSEVARKYFSNNATGSGQRASLSKEVLENLPVFAPSIQEQRNIGSLLSNIDRQIKLNCQINDNLEAMARQLYEYWFVQFDFPDENGRPYKSSGGKMVWCDELKQEIPMSWKVTSILNTCELVRGVTYSPSNIVDANNGVLILRGNNIQNDRIVFSENSVYLPKSKILDEQILKKGDILLNMSSGSKQHLGKCALCTYDINESFGAFLSKLIVDKGLKYLVFLFLTSDYYKANIASICAGTSINNISKSTLSSIYFACPDDLTLNKFNSLVSSFFLKIGINDYLNMLLHEKKSTLIRQLINGQVTVNYHL